MRFVLFALFLSPFAVLAQSYQVGPGDLLKISVWDQEDWDDEFRVDVSGNLQLPLLGSMQVQGLTLVQVRDKIEKDLVDKGFIRNPQVFLDIREIVWKPIRVLGEVRTPGKIRSTSQNIYLLDALTEAGGLLDSAGDKAIIMRQGPDGTETRSVDIYDLVYKGEGNFLLFPGDTITVPRPRTLVISVIGEVNRQGQLVFTGDSEITLLRVIAAAGGFTDYARRNRVLIRRKAQDGTLKTTRHFVADIQAEKADDPVMRHDDVVIVP